MSRPFYVSHEEIDDDRHAELDGDGNVHRDEFALGSWRYVVWADDPLGAVRLAAKEKLRVGRLLPRQWLVFSLREIAPPNPVVELGAGDPEDDEYDVDRLLDLFVDKGIVIKL